MFIALNFNRILIYFLITLSIILESVDNLLSYLAKTFCSDTGYIKYYNNYLKKRGYPGIILYDYENIFNEFHFHSTNKVDLTSIFIFIYGQVNTGQLKFFLNKHSKLEIEVIYNCKNNIEKRFTIEYDFDLENSVYNYIYDKLFEISINFNNEGADILDNFSFVDYHLKIK